MNNSIFEELLGLTQRKNSFPYYDIIKTDDNNNTLRVALAGYKEDDITIEQTDNKIRIEGKQENNEEKEYIHRGITSKNFYLEMSKPKHVKIVDATMEDGILEISLEREVPDEKKPKQIPINSRKDKEEQE